MIRTRLIQFFTTFFAIALVLGSFSQVFDQRVHVDNAYAQSGTPAAPPSGGAGTPANPPSGGAGTPAHPPAGQSGTTAFPSPVKFKTICELLDAFITIIAEVGAIVAVIFIIWSGFLFVQAQGNPEKIKRAKSTFVTTIIGTAILVGASIITKIIVNTVMTVTSGSGSGVGICSS